MSRLRLPVCERPHGATRRGGDVVGAQGLWDSLPATYRQEAICYADAWEAYTAVIPDAQRPAS